jgi:hypothetical protein
MVAARKGKIPVGGHSAMTEYPEDVYTEPSDVDVRTLKNLGPLTGLAGIWEGTRSLDLNPKAEGPKEQAFVERIERGVDINTLRALAPLPYAPVPRPSRPQPRTPQPRWSRRHSA